MLQPVKLRLEDVSMTFKTPRGVFEALPPVTLAIAQGVFVTLIGPSGCGKSTLFNVIAGLLEPSGGRVVIDSVDATGTIGRVGYMLQKDLLLPWRTALDNIVLGASLTRGANAKDRLQAADLATHYGLGGYLHHYPAALSGGMRQRVALMRTLAAGREVMLL